MSDVLTVNSTISCGHGGQASVSSSTKLSVSNGAVLLNPGIMGKSVAGCGTPPASDSSGPTAKPCTTVTAVSAGQSTKLQADGQPVMLSTLAGSTDGMVAKTTPQNLLSATANQTKLTAS